MTIDLMIIIIIIIKSMASTYRMLYQSSLLLRHLKVAIGVLLMSSRDKCLGWWFPDPQPRCPPRLIDEIKSDNLRHEHGEHIDTVTVQRASWYSYD